MKADSFHHSSTVSSRSDANEMDRCEFATAPHGPSYRNLFGPADPCEYYQGAGSGAATRAMLLRLTKAMERRGTAHDSPIPAGYTYLAQFAAHDLVQNPTRVPNLFDGLAARHDLREQRLMLETLYGGGPGACPHLFHREANDGNVDRSRLRLMFIPDERTQPPSMQIRDDYDGGAYRDLPRCVLNDGSVDEAAFATYGDTLLADPRNDDHLIIAQLTVLFALLHNLFVAELKRKSSWDPTKPARYHYLRASRATILVYRKIVFGDLLKQLLHCPIWRAYENDGFRLEKTADTRMAVEFAHAVFRAGHSMVRSQYVLNTFEDARSEELREILHRRGGTNPFDVPHRDRWLIAWSKFFEFDGYGKPQTANPIAPAADGRLITDFMFRDENHKEGGLLYADLLRGAFSGVRSVASLIRWMNVADLPGAADLAPDRWRPSLTEWLRSRAGRSVSGAELTPEDVAFLSVDPPLLLFVMTEPTKKQSGGFGLMGSAIVAETFYAARDQTRHLIEDDQENEALVHELFGEVPKDMAAFVEKLSEQLGYQKLNSPFI